MTPFHDPLQLSFFCARDPSLESGPNLDEEGDYLQICPGNRKRTQIFVRRKEFLSFLLFVIIVNGAYPIEISSRMKLPRMKGGFLRVQNKQN